MAQSQEVHGMMFGKVFMVAVLAMIASFPTLAQKAEGVDTKAFGPIDFEVNGKRVTGTYPKYQGRLQGTEVAPGVVTGYWSQPKSSQPCPTQWNGTYAWGRFVITKFNQATMAGQWSYCNAEATRDIGFR